MKGHIKTASAGVFDVAINLGRDENGKRHQHWKRVHGNRKAAEAELAKMIHELATGAFVELSKAKVSEFLAKWLEHVRTKTARRTLDRYAQIVKHHINPTLGLQASESSPTPRPKRPSALAQVGARER